MHNTHRGKLVTWKADKAFGFIRPQDGGKDVFVHLRDFGRIAREPRVGDVVTYQRMRDGSGRARAADFAIDGLARQVAKPRSSVQMKPRGAHLVVAFTYLAGVTALAAMQRLPLLVPLAFATASLVAFLMYAYDKSAAMNQRWRTKESTLLLVGLLGGWPGALVAQGMFHHKSSKGSFQAAFWMSVVANCAAVAYLSTGALTESVSRLAG